MKWALEELGKRVGEHDSASEYKRTLYRALSANNPHGPSLLDWNKINLQLASHATNAMGAMLMEFANPEVKKYLDTVQTDPALNKKHRSFKLDPVRKTNSEWRMTAWCAAFVNWCLIQAKVTHLGFATAASWVTFGVPLAHPVYGCVVVIAPSSDTGSTTGHVAFYGGSLGSQIWLLGGNQHRTVCWIRKERQFARAYRWPGIIGDFEQRRSQVAVG
jgi:uncharacterized protein (TIGR02594 family)